jgi:hypothetical protein
MILIPTSGLDSTPCCGVQVLTPVNGKKILYSFQYQLEGYKCLGGVCNHIVSKHITQFLVIYDRVSEVSY